jgi:hypothetical protein
MVLIFFASTGRRLKEKVSSAVEMIEQHNQQKQQVPRLELDKRSLM